MPIRSNVAGKIDALVSSVIGNISVAQTVEFNAKNNYVIERHTHTTLPEDGNDTQLDRQWQIYALANNIPASFAISIYEKANGQKGWYLEAKVRDRGQAYIKRWFGAGNADDVDDFLDWSEIPG